jgi:hypothetical protein
MRIRSEYRYQADTDQVFAVLGQEPFHRRVCQATGALDFRVEIDHEGAPDGEDRSTLIRIERTMPTDLIPDFARRLVGPTLRIHEIHRWDRPDARRARSGEVTVRVHEAPVQLVAALRLVPDGTGCLQGVDGDVTASIPFLGSRVSEAAAGAIRAALEAQYTIVESWLHG